MPFQSRPIRRVVTGNDAQGRSCVLFDSAGAEREYARHRAPA